MPLTPKELAEALGNGKEIKQSQYTWVTCCPAHNDSSPSLSITETAQGKTLFKCHAGCSQEHILEELIRRGLWEGSGQSGKSWKILDKAPESARNPNGLVHWKFGAPSQKWEYRNRKGELVGYNCRFDVGGKKELVPLAWGICAEDGITKWRWKSFNKPRPLYNEHLIDKEKTKTILIVEGEKTCDRASEIFPEYLCMTWPGGCNAVTFAGWEHLKGRDVILWQDADVPGAKAMARVGAILHDGVAKTIKQVSLPEDLEEGWDLADDPPPGFDVRACALTAHEFEPSGDKDVDFLNQKHAMVWVGGKCVVVKEVFDPLLNRSYTDYTSVGDCRNYYRNLPPVPVGRRSVPVFDYWLEHPKRRTYDRVVFEPDLEHGNNYNLWRGFSYQPDPTGDWSLLEEHLRENVAQGDEQNYMFIVGWFAHMIQRPREKLGTSIAIRGKTGTGKTIVGKIFGQLIREHYVLVDKPHQVTGQFNAHMMTTLLLEADESFFAGDPKQAGVLKSLVTAETNRIEQKGKDSFEVNNYLRLFITSNEDWVVPAMQGERRFACFECGEGRMKDKKFFQAMEAQMQAGGYEGLLHYLLNFDLDSIDLGDIPDTAALKDQKENNLKPHIRFWLQKLRDGELVAGDGEWTGIVDRDHFYNEYVEHAKAVSSAYRIDRGTFGKELSKLLPEGWPGAPKPLVEIWDPVKQRTVRKQRLHWSFPGLEICRKKFIELYYEIEWPKIDELTTDQKRHLNLATMLPDDEVPF